MNPARLPIGIQTFRELREAGYYYVDKTSHIPPLLNVGKHYFLSRPRRFGKSLFLDTLRELFLGSEPLFRGLAIHDRWDWSVSRPVVSLSFDGGPYSEPGQVKAELMERLDAIEQEHGIRQGAVHRFGPPAPPARSPAPEDRAPRRRSGGRIRQADP